MTFVEAGVFKGKKGRRLLTSISSMCRARDTYCQGGE